MSLKIQITATPAKYYRRLDQDTKDRITEKLIAIAADPTDIRLSYPLKATEKRCTRIGSYRVIFEIDSTILRVAHIGPRGQIYREL